MVIQKKLNKYTESGNENNTEISILLNTIYKDYW